MSEGTGLHSDADSSGGVGMSATMINRRQQIPDAILSPPLTENTLPSSASGLLAGSCSGSGGLDDASAGAGCFQGQSDYEYFPHDDIAESESDH